MFQKILIANRGEIACRIIQTARRMGVETVAVYSDADTQALHVEMADQAVHIGGNAAADSYLCGEKIIQAALDTGAQAIHPGYGFLSENPDFVDAVEATGLTFVGPSAKSIRQMGLKDAAKALMAEAGVPIVPGYHAAAQDTKTLAKAADEIGYPVLIKARAGGGGKGMRLVEQAEEFEGALAAAQREGQASFGDAHVLIEKYITNPRHIEVQVFGDKHGNVVHLFERDCSLQRRHQKVIEEAPAPGMTDDMRAAITGAAVLAAQAIDYVGAGTIEFIVDGKNGLSADGFWFMEMNTRLQVEHPVTEAVTGQDLVEWQLRVASGETLPAKQDELYLNGHSFEARIYAEDPTNEFLPSPGQLHHLAFDSNSRIDTGVRSGDAISPFYDPMIAKLTVHGTDREDALQKLQFGLSGTHGVGPAHNIDFLLALAKQAEFAAGSMDTGLIERHLAELTAKADAPDFVLLAAFLTANNFDPKQPRFGWQVWGNPSMRLGLSKGREPIERKVESKGNCVFALNNEFTNVSRNGSDVSATTQGRHLRAACVAIAGMVSVKFDGRHYVFEVVDRLVPASALIVNQDEISSPMTGTIIQAYVSAGDAVTEGQEIVVVEAMKMEHRLRAQRDGVIAAINCAQGNAVDEGQVLVEFVKEGADD